MNLNVSLTAHLDSFIRHTVGLGRYQSADEVVQMALCLLEEREQEREAELAKLRRDIQKGIDSGPAEPITDQFWQDIQNELRSREQNESNGQSG